MPIEFNCPYCGAMIRVSDKGKGGKGKCPKCSQRITVPKKSTTRHPSPPTELPFDLPKAAASPPAAETDEVVFQEYHEQADADQPLLFAEADSPFEAPSPGQFAYDQVADPAPTDSPPRRKRKPKLDPIATGIVGFIVVAILALAGFILVPLLTKQSLTAQLTASTAESLELPPAAIDKSRIDLPRDELATLLKKLEASPAMIGSASTQIAIGADPSGLLITVTPGSQHQFYRVDPTSSDTVRKFLKARQSDLNDLRFKQVNQAMMGFVNDYMKAVSKKASGELIARYRDTFAIPSLVKGFGNQLAAHHGRSIYPCIYEDADGALYFLLPSGVTEFEIKGRENSSGHVEVPAEIQVKVQGKFDPPKKPKESAKKDQKARSKSVEKASDSDESEMNGNK